MTRRPVTESKDEAPNILSYLFKKVCIELNINAVIWNRLLNNYVNSVTCLEIEGMSIKDDKREIKRRSSLKSNIDTALTDSNMSFDTFIRGNRLLRPDNSVLRVELVMPDEHLISSASNKLLISSVALPIYNKDEAYGVILANILQTFYNSVNPTDQESKSLIQLFLTDPCNGISKDKKLRSSASSNLIRSLKADKLTWGNFQRCLYFLRPKSIRVSLDLTWHSPKRTSGHSVEFKPNFLRS